MFEEKGEPKAGNGTCVLPLTSRASALPPGQAGSRNEVNTCHLVPCVGASARNATASTGLLKRLEILRRQIKRKKAGSRSLMQLIPAYGKRTSQGNCLTFKEVFHGLYAHFHMRPAPTRGVFSRWGQYEPQAKKRGEIYRCVPQLTQRP